MMNAKILTRGGVRPPDDSLISRTLPLANAAVPSRAVVLLRQHAGPAAECVVRPGDSVREGSLLGRAAGPLSANVHSPIPGIVQEVRDTADPYGGVPCRAVVVDFGGEFDRSGKARRRHAWENLSRSDLLARIQAAGVVGLGGGLVPTHVKLARPPEAVVPLLVANGVDSDPSLSADSLLLREKTAEIAEALRICRSILNPARVVLALGEASREYAPAWGQVFRTHGLACELVLLPSRYPQGHEQLVLAALNGAPPSAASSSVVLNVATLHAIWEAVVLGSPLIERVLTVTGTPVVRPRNLKVRIGTRIGDLFEECGGLRETPRKIVVGGPMRGVAVDSLDTPVTKATSGVVAFGAADARTRIEWPCIRCGACIEACPWDLVPSRLHKLVLQGNLAAAREEGLERCTECGCCAFACPSHIPLVALLRTGRKRAAAAGGG
jgi:electron transport complex protein RnfC